MNLRGYNDRLKVAIRDRGLRHQYVAVNCGITASALSQIITGYREPTELQKKTIAEFLGVNQSEVF